MRNFSNRLLLITSNQRLTSLLAGPFLAETDFELYVSHAQEVDVISRIAEIDPDIIMFYVDEDPGFTLVLLSRVMLKRPLPALILASDTEVLKSVIMKCLELGAVDVMNIPSDFTSVSERHRRRLARVLESARHAKLKKITAADVIDIIGDKKADGGLQRMHRAAVAAEFAHGRNFDAVGIAVSTGGPQALSELVPDLPENMPVPIIIVQHIAKGFIGAVASRLDKACEVRVKVAEHGEELRNGIVYLAPDGLHTRVEKDSGNPGVVRIALSPDPADSLFRPSADVLFESMASVYGCRCIALMMTGMGKDGVEGLQAIKKASGHTMAQDAESSAIFGMAQVALEKELIDRVLPLSEIGGALLRTVLGGNGNHGSNESFTS